MDWNWFFSSLAQSVAALVGIFAAFIITKVLQNESEFSRKSAKLRKLLATTEKYREALAVRRFRWVSNRFLEYALMDLDRLLEREEPREPIEYYKLLDFPRYLPLSVVLGKIEERIDSFDPSSVQVAEVEDVAIGPARSLGKKEQRIFELASEERDLIHNLVVDINQHIRLTELHLGEVEDDPESSSLVTMSIFATVLLFFVGVMMPLSFLPLTAGDLRLPGLGDWLVSMTSVKGILLIVVAVVFVSIMGVFWYVNRSSRYKKDEVAQLRESTVLENYSPYLKVRQENEEVMRAMRSYQEDAFDQEEPSALTSTAELLGERLGES
jgi:hypothetical protein